MLTKTKIPVNDLKKILKEYDLGQIENIEPLATSGNIIYIIESDFGKYILRICPEGERWRSEVEVEAELELISYLADNNFPIAEPISKKDGSVVLEWDNKFGYLRRYIDGQAILDPTKNQIKKFGELVGRFHKLTKGYKTKHKREHIWDLEETKKYFKEEKNIILKNKFKKAKDFIPRLEKELSLLNFPCELPQGMIHEDLGKRHIIWQDNKIVGILDFDRCYFGKLILDLGEAIRSWCFVDNWKTWSNENFKSLIKDYQSKRELTDLEKEYLFEAIKFEVLERALAFCLRFIEETGDSEDEKFAWDSLTHQIELLNKNKNKIESILK